MVDEDAHEDWQDDLADLHEDICQAIGEANMFFVPSTRGNNCHVKIDYRGHTYHEYNEALDKLQRLLKQLTASRKCVVEVKGKVGNRQHYGTQAKLPCYGVWNEQRLQEFMDTPIKPFAWLLDIIKRLESRVLHFPRKLIYPPR
jgi:hypothetical protein